MEKSDLKSGMIVELRNGKLYAIIGEKLVSLDGWMTLGSYSERMKCENSYRSTKTLDIIKVYDVECFHLLESINLQTKKYLSLLWAEEVEMTLEEICKELGKNVKIIKNEGKK